MKTTPLILALLAVIGLSSCAEFDAKLKAKTGLDTAAILTLGLSAKLKAEQLQSEYETLKAVEVTAQK
jgi:hypothetical protein